jgi:hypothetical protein
MNSVALEPAEELFGSKKRIQKRQEQRRIDNGKAAMVFRAYNVTLKGQIKPHVDKLAAECRKVLQKLHISGTCMGDTTKAMQDMINHGYANGSGELVSIVRDPKDFNMDVDPDDADWGAIEDLLEKFGSMIKGPVAEFNKNCKWCEARWYDDNDYGCALYIEIAKSADDILALFKSFDSFVGMVYEDVGAIESFKSVVAGIGGITLGIAVAAGFIMFGGYIMTAMGVIAGVAFLGTAIADAISKHREKKDRKNPTEEEKASMALFQSKYEPIMAKEAGALWNIISSIQGELKENGIILEKVPVSHYFNNDPYSHFIAAVATIKEDPNSNADSDTQRAIAAKIAPKVDKFRAELDRKYNGVISCGCTYDRKMKGSVIGISFEWIARDGYILPNLR